MAGLFLAATLTVSGQVRSTEHRILKEPPFYHTFRKAPQVATDPVVVLPVRPYDGPSESPLFDQSEGLAAIAAAVDARVATLAMVRRVEGPTLRGGHWPSARLGDEEIVTGEPRQAGNRRTAIAITRPSRDWTRAMQPILTQAGATSYLVISVGIADLYLRQDWRGRKSLPIGTDYVVPVPWLNDLESTVGVLTLSGALYDRDGRVLRAGSEGVLAGAPTFWQGVLAKTITGGRGRISTIGDAEDPQAVLSQRRADLPGQPLAWEVALEHLVRQLLGREAAPTPAATR